MTTDVETNTPLVPFDSLPKTLKQAIESPEADQWRQAMMSEVIAHWKLATVRPVQRTSGMNVPPSQWVFTLKSDEDGFHPKARWVIGGHRQREHEYGETYAATVKFESIRLLLDLAILIYRENIAADYLLDRPGKS
jgi:hypothetical protein